MLNRSQQLRMLVAGARENLRRIDDALEALESGDKSRSHPSILARAFSQVKHDALHLRLSLLARLAAASQAVVENAKDRRLGVPIELLADASAELRLAVDKIDAGGRHRLNRDLLARLEQASTQRRVERD